MPNGTNNGGPRDYLDCGDDYLNCDDDYLNCQDDYLNCQDDTEVNPPEPSPVEPTPVEPPKPPVIEPRKDNWLAELFYKVIIFFNRIFRYRH